jgi:hypothetical protein
METRAEQLQSEANANNHRERQNKRSDIIRALEDILKKGDKNPTTISFAIRQAGLDIEDGFEKRPIEEIRSNILDVVTLLKKESEKIPEIRNTEAFVETQSPTVLNPKGQAIAKLQSAIDQINNGANMTTVGYEFNDDPDHQITPEQQNQLLNTLRERFNSKPSHYQRLDSVSFNDVKMALEKSPAMMWALYCMEATGGKPDVVADNRDHFLFADCSPEAPVQRRNCVFDKDMEKTVDDCNGNALDMAKQFGVELLDRITYEDVLQKIGEFDTESYIWMVNNKGQGTLKSRNVKKGGPLYLKNRQKDAGWRGMVKVYKVN